MTDFYRSALKNSGLKLPIKKLDSSGEPIWDVPWYARAAATLGLAVLTIGLLFFMDEIIANLPGVALGLLAVGGAFTWLVLKLTFLGLTRVPWALYFYFFSSIVLSLSTSALVMNASDSWSDALPLYLCDGGMVWIWLVWFRLGRSLRPLLFAALHLLCVLAFALVEVENVALMWILLTSIAIRGSFLVPAILRVAALKRFCRF